MKLESNLVAAKCPAVTLAAVISSHNGDRKAGSNIIASLRLHSGLEVLIILMVNVTLRRMRDFPLSCALYRLESCAY